MGRRWLPAAAITFAILVVTLTPVDDPSAPRLAACLACGDRWLADFLANVPFFVPLGAALAWGGASAPVAIALGTALSFLIEAAQLVIPGRYTSAIDLAANAAGTAVGVAVVHGLPRLLAARGSARARARTRATAVALLLLGLPPLMARPALPDDSDYYPQWAPRLAHLEPWEGSVHDFRVGPLPLGHADTEVTEALREALLAGEIVSVEASAGPPPERISAIVAIHDGRQREVALVGQRGYDLTWRHRRLAAVVALHPPTQWWPGALQGVPIGAPLAIQVEPEPGGTVCLRVGVERLCEAAPSTARGWALVLPSELLPLGVLPWVDLAWLVALGALPALWFGTRPLIPSAILALGVLVGPYLGPVAPVGPGGWAALAAGVTLSALAGTRIRSRLRNGGGAPPPDDSLERSG